MDGSPGSLAHYTYTYDVANRLTSETINGTTTSFNYNAVNQLTQDGANNFTYDAAGNRTMSGYQTDAGNRVVNDGTYTYTYDDEGNLVKKSKGADDETWEFGFEHRNQLIWAEQRDTDGGTLLMRSDYANDVFGNRIEKAVDPDGDGAQGTTTTRFAQDGWNPVRTTPIGLENYDAFIELDENNDLSRRLIHGDVVDEVFAHIGADGTASWYLPDRLGSLRDIVDASGSLIDHRVFDAFGNMVSETSPSDGDAYGFTGRYFDVETGLQHNRARYYDSVTGRWISEDPIGFEAGDLDLFRYLGNNPTNGIDPSGYDLFVFGDDALKFTLDTFAELKYGVEVGQELLPGSFQYRNRKVDGKFRFPGTYNIAKPFYHIYFVNGKNGRKKMEQGGTAFDQEIADALRSWTHHTVVYRDTTEDEKNWYKAMDLNWEDLAEAQQTAVRDRNLTNHPLQKVDQYFPTDNRPYAGLDITNTLTAVMAEFVVEFNKLSVEDRVDLARGLTSSGTGQVSWDIEPFYKTDVYTPGDQPKAWSRGEYGKGKNQKYVTVNGRVHFAGAVNYILWGHVMKEINAMLYAGKNIPPRNFWSFMPPTELRSGLVVDN